MMLSTFVVLLFTAVSLALEDLDATTFNVDLSKLPGFDSLHAPQNLSSHAGHIEIDNGHGSLFFWDFYNDWEKDRASCDSDSDRPLLIWLNGGPGCSSMDGALMEIGPLRVDSQETLVWNKGWFDKVDMMFIDQPLGTGFSTLDGEYETNLVDSSKHLVEFLVNYATIFRDQWESHKSIIIAGESYAGQYIPHLANLLKNHSLIAENNKSLSLMLGNAWIDPNLQSLSYIPYLMSHGIIEDDSKLEKLLTYHDQCQNVLRLKDVPFESTQCEMILNKILSTYRKKDKSNGIDQCLNVYDISKVDNYPSCGNNWPELLPSITHYLNLPEVQSALNIDHKEWMECNNNVHRSFDPHQISAKLLKGLLDGGIRIQLFSGTNDLICNYLGTEMVIANYILNDPSYKFEMNAWFHDEQLTGEMWYSNNLTYVKVNDASHMVPYDYPVKSAALLDILLTDTFPNTFHTSSTEEVGYADTDKDSDEVTDRPTITTRGNRWIIAYIILILLIASLAFYIYRALKSRRYSSLSQSKPTNTYTGYALEWMTRQNGEKRKKKVHWLDIQDENNDGDSNPNEMDTDTNNVYDNNTNNTDEAYDGERMENALDDVEMQQLQSLRKETNVGHEEV
ncbi:unnamed protein product [Pichia kudriavzevii]